MDFFEMLKKIQGAEAALGFSFTCSPQMNLYLPYGSKPIGQAGQILFCCIEEYQETVFAVDTDPVNARKAYPIAYDFREFIRLIIACGSAEMVARAGQLPKNEYEVLLRSEWENCNHRDLKRLQAELELTPVQDPFEYVKTVGQVIDCSRIRC